MGSNDPIFYVYYYEPMKDVQWSAYVLLPSNRLQKVEFMCPSNLREDAENRCKSLFGVTDVRQLKREWS